MFEGAAVELACFADSAALHREAVSALMRAILMCFDCPEISVND